MESFRQKLAHNSRVSLGPRDIKLLQECITSERKLVDQETRLAGERDKASHALREWAGAEGPDLNDVVSKVCTLYEYLSKAEMAYAEHNGNYRIRFKEIRSKEENLAGLKKARDSLGGRIEAQDRKVSKMKEENKDLPTQKQRLRDMQQEMIGLEHSVVTEETRLGDFKRAATRAALSLKLGAMLELAEKTVIVAELGKLMVDMLPTDETEAGQPRAYYDGYSRTEELLSEAQRCLQDVVFNPAPITEGFSQHQYGSGGVAGGHALGESVGAGGYGAEAYRSQHGHGDSSAYPRDQFDETGIRPVDPNNDYGAQTPTANYRDEPSYGTYSSTYAEHGQPAQATRYGSAGLGSSGPQLQPLPDFRPLSSFQPAGAEDLPNQWSDARQHSYGHPDVPISTTATASGSMINSASTPVHDAFATSSAATPASSRSVAGSSALAPPVPDLRNSADRSSLAYMGSEPDYDAATETHHSQVESDTVEAREAAQAHEDAARHQAQPEDHSDAYDAAISPSVYTRQTHGDSAGPTPTDEYHPDLPTAPAAGASPLSPIVEVATPDMTQVASPDPQAADAKAAQHDSSDFQSTDYAQVPRPTGESATLPREGELPRPYSSTSTAESPYSTAESPYSTAPSYVTDARSDAAQYGGWDSPRVRQASAERAQNGALSPPNHAPDVPTSPTGGTFEPRPISMRFNGDAGAAGQRRPIQIRPAGDAPLGSKYGDLTVGSPGAYSSSNAPRTPNENGAPGYLGSGPSSPMQGNGEPKRTLPAGAFRRPQPGASPASPGLRQSSASGYQFDPASSAQSGTPGSGSESAAIAQRWRDSSAPTLSPEQQRELEQAGEGELPVTASSTGTATPSFDVRPLQVNRTRNGTSPGGMGRSGTMPSPYGAAHMRSSSYTGVPASNEPASYGAVSTQTAPDAATQPYGQDPVMQDGIGDGFGSNRFVTRLD